MDDPIYQIDTVLVANQSQRCHTGPVKKAKTDFEIDNKKPSGKFVIENRRLVYERYDKHGRVVLKVPSHTRTLCNKI